MTPVPVLDLTTSLRGDFLSMASGRDNGGVLARRASFFDHSPRACFCPPPPPPPNNLEYLLAVSKNPARPLHPVYDDVKGGGWKWWE